VSAQTAFGLTTEDAQSTTLAAQLREGADAAKLHLGNRLYRLPLVSFFLVKHFENNQSRA
jgi:hypothetical protein